MIHPPRFKIHFLWCCLFLIGCTEKKQISQTSAEKNTALLHFEKAKEAGEPREIISHLNRALQEVENRKDTLVPLLLDYKIYYHSNLKERDSAFYFSDSLINWGSRAQDTTAVALGYYRKSRVHFQLREHEQVFRNAFEARRLSLLIGDSTDAGQRSLEMSLAQGRLGDHTGSQESATEALRYLDPEKDSLYISSAYNNIAIANRLREFYDDAEKEFRNALRFSTTVEDSLKFMNNIALVLLEKGDHSRAIEIFEKLLARPSDISSVSKLRFEDNLAYTKWLKNPEVEVEKELLDAMETRRELNDQEGLLASYIHLVEYYKRKNPAGAEKYAKALLETSRKSNNSSSELQALKFLVELSPREGWVQEYIVLNDSLNHTGLTAQNTFAKIRFDEERKQQEIENLETKSISQTLLAQKLRNQNLILFLVGLLVILMLFFLIYYLRQRHKKERIMEIHRTENRISKVIHDELANDIFNLMSSLEPLAPVPVIDKLEKIYLRTRDISRENSELDTGEDYIKNLISTLSNNLPEHSRLIIKGENTVAWNKITAEKKIVIYRVLQELMVNMKKHSRAKLVAIGFLQDNKYLNINYSDNGRGVEDGGLNKGSGLQNVENRIFSLNGSINFESETEKGFQVSIRIPV